MWTTGGIGETGLQQRRSDRQYGIPTDGADPRHVVMIRDGGVTKGAERVDFEGSGVTVVEIGTALDSGSITRRLRLHVTAESVTVCGQDCDEVIARPDMFTRIQASVCARRLAPYRLAAARRRSTWMAGPDGYR